MSKQPFWNVWSGLQRRKTRGGWEERAARMAFVKPAPPKPQREITQRQARDSTRAKRARADREAKRSQLI